MKLSHSASSAAEAVEPVSWKGLEPLRILTGQTASGKSAVAVCLAKTCDAEIISLDSMKLYRGLDIGSAKPSLKTREEARFHLVDVVEPTEAFSLARFLGAAHEAAVKIVAAGRRPLFVGGTPLYLRGLLYGIFSGPGADWSMRESLMQRAQREGPQSLHDELAALDPVAAARLHPNDLTRVIRALEVVRGTGRPLSAHQTQFPAERPAVASRMVVLRRSEEDLQNRIRLRAKRMFDAGLVEEAKALSERGALSRPLQKAIGYREVLAYLRGEHTLDETIELVRRNTWRMARKQMTWFRSFPKAQWLDVSPDEPAEAIARRASEMLFGSDWSGIVPGTQTNF